MEPLCLDGTYVTRGGRRHVDMASLMGDWEMGE